MSLVLPRTARLAAILAALFLLAAMSPSLAQQAVTDAELKSFVAATVAMQRIGNDYQSRIAAAPDDAGKQQLRQQSVDEMGKALQAEGLTLERYSAIAKLTQDDPAVRKRVTDLMQQAK